MSDMNLPFPPNPPPAGIPLSSPMVPMTFSQILDRIFRLMRANLKPFLVIGLLPMGVLFVFEGFFFAAMGLAGVFVRPPAHPDPIAVAWVIGLFMLLGLPVMVFVYGIYYAAASYAAVRADQGLTVSAGEALRLAWSKAGRYTWLMVLRGLIVALPILVCAFAFFVGGLLLGLFPKGNANTAALFFLIPLVVLLYLGSLVYAIVMSLRLSLAYPACVQEGLTARRAITRSAVLTQGAKGRIFLALLVIYAIGYAFFLVFYIVGIFIVAIGAVAGIGHIHAASPGMYILLGLLAVCALVVILLWAILLMAAYSTAFAVFYRDQCLRKDGLPPSPVHSAQLA